MTKTKFSAHYCLDHPDEAEAEIERLRAALQEIADGKHGFSRPAGLIASKALERSPVEPKAELALKNG